jgi:hypothetical protein
MHAREMNPWGCDPHFLTKGTKIDILLLIVGILVLPYSTLLGVIIILAACGFFGRRWY